MNATQSPAPQGNARITVRRSEGAAEDGVVVEVPESGAAVDQVERALIAFALHQTSGNRTHAARFLGLSRSALIYRIQKHRLVARTDTLGRRPSEDGDS